MERIKNFAEGKSPYPRKSTSLEKSKDAYMRRFENRRKRAEWQDLGNKATHLNFPYETCNGKKYRKYR